MFDPLSNPLDIELTKGPLASVGIPERLIVAAGFSEEAQEFVDRGLARWDQDPVNGMVLKAKGQGLWTIVREKELMQQQ